MISALPAEFDPAYGLQPELGEMARQSGRLLSKQFHAQLIGAENLLTKAMRALASGDEERADRLTKRAAQMGYDEREEEFPGVRAASMLVYGMLSDQVEFAEEGDTRWLDVVFDVYPSLDALGQAEVASVVNGFVLQEWILFELAPEERRRIQQAFGDAPLDAERGDNPDSTVEQRHAIIRSLTRGAAVLAAAYDRSDAMAGN